MKTIPGNGGCDRTHDINWWKFSFAEILVSSNWGGNSHLQTQMFYFLQLFRRFLLSPIAEFSAISNFGGFSKFGGFIFPYCGDLYFLQLRSFQPSPIAEVFIFLQNCGDLDFFQNCEGFSHLQFRRFYFLSNCRGLYLLQNCGVFSQLQLRRLLRRFLPFPIAEV